MALDEEDASALLEMQWCLTLVVLADTLTTLGLGYGIYWLYCRNYVDANALMQWFKKSH